MNLRRFLQIYVVAGVLAVAVFWAFYSQRLLKQLEEETLFRSRLYANYTKALASPDSEMMLENLLFEEIVSKINFPVVITDSAGNPQNYRNVPLRNATPKALPSFIQKLDSQRDPIPIKALRPIVDTLTLDTLGFDTLTLSVLHYGLPETWRMLQYFPLIQASFIALFVVLGFVFIFASARREQERLWASLAREAAHQLGTPVSSLLGWVELTKSRLKKEAAKEIEADLERIREILDRFARIGDKPRLEPHEIEPIIRQTVRFIETRAPSRIEFETKIKDNALLLIDPTLVSWTLENLMRNSIDAIGRKPGKILVTGERIPKSDNLVLGTLWNLERFAGDVIHLLSGKAHKLALFSRKPPQKHDYEITVFDTGAGIRARHADEIFRTGFTTKRHGWGIGLALSRRVIEQLHRGKLKVKSSKPGRTVLSIVLPLWHE